MKADDVTALVQSRFRRSILPARSIADDDCPRIEDHFQCRMPEAFSVFRSLIGIYRIEGDHLSCDEIVATVAAERGSNPLWDEDLLPFYALGNGDYLCLRRSECPNSRVYFVPHDEDEIRVLHSSFDEYLRDAEWFN